MEVAQVYQDRLSILKTYVSQSYFYNKPNVERFNKFRKEVFDTAVSEDQKALLKDLGKPPLEFNIGESYVSRLRGEFFKQEPSLEISAQDGTPVDPQKIQVVEGIIRHDFTEANKNGFEYDVYTDLLSGGFSVICVYTDYLTTRSFNQGIKFKRAFDPTLCGFDPLARYPHKADGRYSFEYRPYTLEQAKAEFKNLSKEDFSFTSSAEEFKWSYDSQKEKIIVICDLYEKVQTKETIVLLSNQKVICKGDYEKFVTDWNMNPANLEQVPGIIDERKTTIEKIHRYRFCESKVLEHKLTNYAYLPHIWVDGNSILIKDDESGSSKQVCRPYLYHARGAQQLKNFAGQTWAAEIENMVMHKFKVAEESLPDQEKYLDAYSDMQKSKTFIYKAYDSNDPNKALPPPQEIIRTPMPPEVMNAFIEADKMFQSILGNYDGALGINDNQLSGLAVIEAASQSNSTAMPFLAGFLQALNQLGTIYIDLIPKYLKEARTIPMMDSKNKKVYQRINDKDDKNSISLDYEENSLQIKVEAGVNFAVQKNRALQQIIALMNVSEIFRQFMETEGLEIMLDNMEFRGVDILKKQTSEWMQLMKQRQEQSQNQPSPEMLKYDLESKKLAQKGQETQSKTMVDIQKLKQAENKIVADLQMNQQDSLVQVVKADTERFAKKMDALIKKTDMSHRHNKEKVEVLHKIHQANKPEHEPPNGAA